TTPPPQAAVEAPEIEDAPVQVAEAVDPHETDTISDRSAAEVVGQQHAQRYRPGRPSGRMGAVSAPGKKISQRGPAVGADEALAKGPSSSSSRSGRSSRRMESPKASRRGRDEREERDEKKDKRRGGSSQGMSTGMMVGIGVGVV